MQKARSITIVDADGNTVEIAGPELQAVSTQMTVGGRITLTVALYGEAGFKAAADILRALGT